MSLKKGLKITKVGGILVSEDKRNYRKIEMSVVSLNSEGQVIMNSGKTVAINAWEKGPEIKGPDGKGTGKFSNSDSANLYTASAGQLFAGAYVRRETTPYVITEGKEPVTSYAMVVLEESDNFALDVKKAFARAAKQNEFTLVEEQAAHADKGLVALEN